MRIESIKNFLLCALFSKCNTLALLKLKVGESLISNNWFYCNSKKFCLIMLC